MVVDVCSGGMHVSCAGLMNLLADGGATFCRDGRVWGAQGDIGQTGEGNRGNRKSEGTTATR